MRLAVWRRSFSVKTFICSKFTFYKETCLIFAMQLSHLSWVRAISERFDWCGRKLKSVS
jgi:hypothetical protein